MFIYTVTRKWSLEKGCSLCQMDSRKCSVIGCIPGFRIYTLVWAHVFTALPPRCFYLQYRLSPGGDAKGELKKFCFFYSGFTL